MSRKKTYEASISVKVLAKDGESEGEAKERAFMKLIRLVDDWMVGEVISTITYTETNNHGGTSTKDNIYLN